MAFSYEVDKVRDALQSAKSFIETVQDNDWVFETFPEIDDIISDLERADSELDDIENGKDVDELEGALEDIRNTASNALDW